MIEFARFVCLVLFTVPSSGLDMSIAVKRFPVSGAVCGVLTCVETFHVADESDPSIKTITNMTVYKRRHSMEQDSIVASWTTNQSEAASRFGDYEVVWMMEKDKAVMGLTMYKAEDCASEFVCKIHGVGSQGQIIALTSRLLRERTQSSDLTAMFLDLRHQLKRTAILVRKPSEELAERVKALETNLENKVGAVKDQLLHALASLKTDIKDDVGVKADELKLRLQLASQQFESAVNSSTNKAISSTEDLFNKPTLVNGRQMMHLISSVFTPKICAKGVVYVLSQSAVSKDVIIYPSKGGQLDKPFLCDAVTLGGGWILIQRRVHGRLNFYRNWADYKHGFGSMDGDFWLGNDAIHAITHRKRCAIRIELIYDGKQRVYSQYSSFSLGDEAHKYVLSVSGYSGTSGNYFAQQNGKLFSTYDRDNDEMRSVNCAADYRGAWWYDSCSNTNLNGKWGDISFGTCFVGCSVTRSEMKIRCPFF